MSTSTPEQMVKALGIHGRAAHLRSELAEALAWATRAVTAVNEDKGWYDDERTFGDDIALLHSEVSEALEAFRDHGTKDATKSPWTTGGVVTGLAKPEGVGSEFADVLIRLLDTCSRSGIDLAAEFERKLQFNATRPFRHGGRSL